MDPALRNLFSLVFLLSTFALLGQSNSKRFDIEWNGSSSWFIDNPDNSIEIPLFYGASADESFSNLPIKFLRIPIPSGVKSVSLDILKEVDLTGNDKGLSDLESNYGLKFEIRMEKKQNFLLISVLPYRKVNGVTRRLVEFELVWTETEEVKQKTQKVQAYKSQSVLANGRWVKVSVTKTGLYKISAQYLNSNDINFAGVSSNEIRVFGNGNGMLPEDNATLQYDDIEEVPIQVVENGNGIFDGNDYILFYAKGPHQWKESSGVFTHEQNLYSDVNTYFIAFDLGPSKKVSLVNVSTLPATNQVTSFDDYAFIENDLFNLIGTGKQWFGEKFDFTPSYNYSFSFPWLRTAEPLSLRTRAVARSSTAGTFLNYSVAGSVPVSLLFDAINLTVAGADYVNAKVGNNTFLSPSSAFTITTTYNNSVNPSAIAWMDFVEVQCRRDLNQAGLSQLQFRDSRSAGVGEVSAFSILNSNSDAKIWNVTDHLNIEEIIPSFQGSTAQFKVQTDTLMEFVAFRGNDFPEPGFIGVLENQNLHSLAAPELLIIYHPSLESAVQVLADFHRNDQGISVEMVPIDKLYNEFSSGVPDLTAIKNISRMFYERSGPNSGLKNLLLFGDASYDYKDRLTNKTNLVPTWESNSSFSLNVSICSDDYFGFLDPNEGGVNSVDQLDVGIGRFVARNLSNANAMVNKIIRYSSDPLALGNWRSNILIAADDVDLSWETALMRSAEQAAAIAAAQDPRINQEKIYIDSYQQIISGGSERYPQAQDQFIRSIQGGNLITAYTGHGGEIGLASERILQLNDINSWTNRYAMPLCITITCEFTRYDDPQRISAGEYGHLNPNGGFIALYSTQRVVYASPQTLALTAEIFDTALHRPNGVTRSLGEIIRMVKNNNPGRDKLSFSLFGDPAMKLAIPNFNIATTEVNGINVSTFTDTINSLNQVSVKGRIEDHAGQLLSSFNGEVRPIVYDKEVLRQTLVNDGVGSPQSFVERNNIVYQGRASVVNGEFSFKFVVPLDISYQFGKGRIAYYAADGADDAAGFYEDFYLGGLDTTASLDTKGPEVALYLNDESFVNGGMTNEAPEIYAVLSDSSGINTVGRGIGHDILAILDGDINNAVVLNEYYTADVNSFQKGSLRFALNDLSEGSHTLTLRAWDVYNNPSESTIDFIVADSEDLTLRYVLNYPNPFTTYTEFQFEHNRANQPLEVLVQVFTVSGKMVKTIRREIIPQGNRVTGISWDGLDDYGDRIGKGVYMYKLSVRSKLDQSQAQEYQKLVILR